MEIPIEKERLFKILNDISTFIDRAGKKHLRPTDHMWTYAFVYDDTEAVQLLKDLREEVRIYLKDEFLTHIGLALFRDEEKGE